MTLRPDLGLLFLHALPLDGSMWSAQENLLPGATYTPTLYRRGHSVGEWAASALNEVEEERLIVVGCSIGGSCALEVAAAAPQRVAALVLIGTKADHRPDPQLHASALETIEEHGLELAWETFWAPLFSRCTGQSVVDAARDMFFRRSAEDLRTGITAFHSRPSRGDMLSMFRGPVTVVTGANDIAPGIRVSAAQASAARDGTLMIVPDCGHYVPLERPERLNEILRRVISAEHER
ncbi:hypothetical protein B0E45_20975 [Sinorhizobium sp. A49]|uniref:alpha/beta fold hydrolase n=1 Tax=Sinorhizobium sp. A49 TaxID=1945861 RepID=UPI000984EB76|nr:alpha/beta hydrolase [Sinorhizobium sp. A49]OOG67875.1 hypothetical protein B0E45_20975 [Sinorhizobium sp. A49]